MEKLSKMYKLHNICPLDSTIHVIVLIAKTMKSVKGRKETSERHILKSFERIFTGANFEPLLGVSNVIDDTAELQDTSSQCIILLEVSGFQSMEAKDRVREVGSVLQR